MNIVKQEESKTLLTIKSQIEQMLKNIPSVVVTGIESQPKIDDAIVDLKFDLTLNGNPFILLVEYKSPGEPRIVRGAIQQLRDFSKRVGPSYSVVAAPYISEATANLCKQNDVGFIDLAGNGFIAFDGIYIESRKFPNQSIEKRRARSLFSPKSSRILRVLLNNPQKRQWGIKELAREAEVSIGLVSRVKDHLLDLEYLGGSKNYYLDKPEKLLQEWANNYSFRKNGLFDYFSFDDVKTTERKISEYCNSRRINYGLTLFSGAALVAPFSRYTRSFVYIDTQMIQEVADHLGLKAVDSGPNLTILGPFDEGIFHGSRKVDGMNVVSDIQLYLDLVAYKGRGEEAAKFLFEERILPSW